MLVKKDLNFISFFDEKTGKYMRTGIIKDGKDTGIDPFMASFPELLDIGIMGHCLHGSKGLCINAGVECYQDGLHSKNKNMSFSDFSKIISQCKGKTFQVALGGCGDPDQHENFSDILKLCVDNEIIPNFTTSGFGLSDTQVSLCKKYCGAVAVSWYRSDYTHKAIQKLIDAGIKTNIHYVLHKNSLAEAMQRVKDNAFPKGINAVVFLLHKPVGLGSIDNVIQIDNKDFFEFIHYAVSNTFDFKIGFDSCTMPALLHDVEQIDIDCVDTCEGGRWSAYITPDLKFLPCSFDNQDQRWAVDLNTHTIQEAWDSQIFEDFRKHFRLSCPECTVRKSCLGGCPICPSIVLCKSRFRSV